MSFKFSNAFYFIIVAIFFGALSGILGFIIIGAGNFRIPFVGTINYAGSSLDNNIIIQQPRSVVLEQDTQIQQIENDLLPTIIDLYHTKKSTDPLVAAYSDADRLGHGFVLTADGLVISTVKVVTNLRSQYSAVGYQNKKYALDSFVVDGATGIVFGKMPASNLSVAKIGKSSGLRIGQTVVVVSGRNKLSLTTIAKIGYDFPQNKDLVLGSDILRKRIHVAQSLTDEHEGGLLVNFKGEVIGIISNGEAIPVDYFSNIINQYLAKQVIVRPALGIDYLDLAQVDGLIDFGEKGAYVAYEPLRGTAAYGLVKKGDVIKKVNDIELNNFVGLAEALNNFQPTNSVELLVNRGGQDLTLPVILK